MDENCYSPFGLIFLITLAGAPAAITLSGIFLLTKLKASMIEFSPIETPGITTLPTLQFSRRTILPSFLSIVEME